MRLQEIGMMYGTDKATAHHYLDFYEDAFENFHPKKILEIGVHNGASLRMWDEYFPAAIVVGLDTNPPIVVPGCIVMQGDATDIYHMAELFANHIFDLIIDDGSHFTKDQQTAFHFLFNYKLMSGGFYIVEDIHTSFIPAFVNSKFSTYELLTSRYLCAEYWDKKHKTDSGTLIIQK